MATLDQIAAKIAVKPASRYEHPSVAVRDVLDPGGEKPTLPIPKGHQLCWRLNELVLLDNFDGLFDNSNEVRIVGITIDSNVKDPIQVSTPLPFPGVRKNNRLPLGDKGLMMYYASPDELPRYLGIQLVLIEDDSDLRDIGKVLSQARASEEYKTILTTATALASAANPVYGTLISAGDALAGMIGKLLEQNGDDLIAYFAATYTLAFDGLGVGKHTFHQDKRARAQYEILVKPAEGQ